MKIKILNIEKRNYGAIVVYDGFFIDLSVEGWPVLREYFDTRDGFIERSVFVEKLRGLADTIEKGPP